MSEMETRLLADSDLVTRRRGSSVLVAADSWQDAVDLAESLDVRILGMEGFTGSGSAVRSDDDFIADFGDPDADESYLAARRILSAWLDAPDCPDWVEFVTD